MFNMANQEIASGNLTEAAKLFEKIIKVQPYNSDMFYYLGLVNYQMGSFETAVKCFTNSLSLNPEKKGLYFQLGMAYLKMKRYDEAEKTLALAEQIYGDNPFINLNKGLIDFERGKMDKAIVSLKKSLTKEQDGNLGPDPHFILGQAYYYSGLADEAQEQFNKVVKMAPGTGWEKSATAFILQIEKGKTAGLKELEYSIFVNSENDSNVTFALTTIESNSDSDKKMTLFLSIGYRPLYFGKTQPAKVSYSYYMLNYASHNSLNFGGHMIDASYNLEPFKGSLLALKTGINNFSLSGRPYMTNFNMLDATLTASILPLKSTWTILNLSFTRDDYKDSSYRARNANNFTAGIKQYINEQTSIGLEMKESSSQGSGTGTDDFSYSSQQISVNYAQPLAFGVSLLLNGSYTNKDYKNNDSAISPLMMKRKDQLVNISGQLVGTGPFGIGLIAKAGYTADICNILSSALGYTSYTSKTFSIGASKAF